MFGFTGAKFKGAYGQKRVQYITQTINFQDLPMSEVIVFNATGTITVNGMMAPKDMAFVRFVNVGTNNISINHANVAARLGNRFSFPNNAQQNIKSGYGVEFWYDFQSQVWRLIDQPHIIASTPLAVGAGNNISITQSGSSSNGWISSTDWNTFNNKLSNAGGTAGSITYWGTSTTLSSNANFVWKNTTQRMGVQQNDPLGALHLKSAVLETVANPTSNSATLVQFNAVSGVSSASATQVVGRMLIPTSPNANENGSGLSPWTAGDSFDYKISQYYYDGDVTYTESSTTTPFSNVVLVTNNNGVDLNWIADSSGSFGAPAGFILYRNINGGGWEWIDLGYVTSVVDDGIGMSGGDFPQANGGAFDDYVANGTTRNYVAYSQRNEAGQVVYDVMGSAYSMTDDSSAKPYRVSHTITTGETSARVIGAADGVSATDHIDGLSFIEVASSWIPGNDVSLTSIGYTSDGFTLNREYRLYQKGTIATIPVFSAEAGAITGTTTDPNNALKYYIQLNLNWTGDPNSTGFKTILSIDGGGYLYNLDVTTASTSGVYYDTGTEFVSGANVEPHGVAVAALYLEHDGSETISATMNVKALSSYFREDIFDASLVKLADRQYKDSDKSMSLYFSGLRQYSSGVIATQTSSVTVANTTTETSLIGTLFGTNTLPADFFVAGRTIRITARGYHSSTANPNINVRMKLGSTTICSTGNVASGNGSNNGFLIDCELVCRTTGGSGAFIGQGNYEELHNSGAKIGMVSTATSSINTAASQVADVTVQWGTANAGNTFTCTNLTIEVLR